MKDHLTLRINYPNHIEIMFTLAPNKNIAFQSIKLLLKQTFVRRYRVFFPTQNSFCR